MKGAVVITQAFALGALALPAKISPGDRSSKLQEALEDTEPGQGIKLAEIFGDEAKLLSKRQEDGEADATTTLTEDPAEPTATDDPNGGGGYYPYNCNPASYSDLYAYFDDTKFGASAEYSEAEWCRDADGSATGNKDTQKASEYLEESDGEIFYGNVENWPCPDDSDPSGGCPSPVDPDDGSDTDVDLPDLTQAQLDEQQAQEDLEQAQLDEEQAQLDEEAAQSLFSQMTGSTRTTMATSTVPAPETTETAVITDTVTDTVAPEPTV